LPTGSLALRTRGIGAMKRMLIRAAEDETFAVRFDTGTPIDDGDCRVPSRFTARLARLKVKPKPMKARLTLRSLRSNGRNETD
jgi:hypothetical protein